MFVNFIVVSLGINWFLGFFGLALKPLADLDNQEESVLKLKEKKRKLEEIDMLSGVDGGQEKLTKRPKPEEVVVQEEDAAETEDEELSIKKSVGSKDKAKAIAEFQSRLWNMKPDFNFLDVEPKTEAKVMQAESEYKLAEEIEGDRKDVVKKVINPSESFDNVLNMSDDTSEIPTGDDVVYVDNDYEDIIDVLVEEEDVSVDDATIGDPIDTQNGQYEERREEIQVETVATDVGLNLKFDPDLISKVNEDKADLETEPAGTPSLNECQKIENNLSETQNSTEEESVADGIDDGPAQADYPVLVKPDYAVQAKPDYQVQEKPDYALQEKPDYALLEKPDYALLEKPDYHLQEKPDYALQEKPDYQVQHKPDYPVIEKPIYQVLEKPEYPVKEKLGCPISEKFNYQALEKPISALLDSMDEKQDDHQLATKNDGSVSEVLDQLATSQRFLEGQCDEKSRGATRQITTVEDQTENEDAATEDNDEYESLKMESCKNTIELGEEKKVTEEGQMSEKSDEMLAQLSTSEKQTEEENSAAHDDARAENPGEVCEESIAVDVEEKKSGVAEKEGRRGSVGSKGKGGGNKSGSKQKKKKRKIL